MAEHLDLDALADALEAPATADPHLAGCADCTARLAELRAASPTVTAALAALPNPPLPAGLAERLSAAFAAEPSLAAPTAGSGTGGTGGTATVTPLAPRRRSWLPAAAAAAAVLVFGGALGVSALTGSDRDADTAVTALDSAAGATADDAPRNESGTDYADDANVTAVLPSVLAGTAPRRFSDNGAAAAAPPADTSFSASSAPRDDALAAESTELQLGAVDPLARLRDPAGLASCLAALLPPEEPDVRPLALDYATFAGEPALAVVLPDPDPAKLAVFVVGPGCSQEDDSVLRFVRVAKP